MTVCTVYQLACVRGMQLQLQQQQQQQQQPGMTTVMLSWVNSLTTVR